MICPNCGKRMEEGVVLCSHCGERLPKKERGDSKPISSEAPAMDRGSPQRSGRLKKSMARITGHRWLIVIMAIFVLCLLIGGGYAAYHYSSKNKVTPGAMPTRDQFTKEQELSRKAAAMYEKLATAKGASQAASETVQWLEKQGDVKDAGVGDGCLWVTYKDGSKRLILTTDPNIKK